MKAVVFGGIGKVKVTDLPKPTLQKSTDVIVKVTHATICGYALLEHLLKGKLRHSAGLHCSCLLNSGSSVQSTFARLTSDRINSKALDIVIEARRRLLQLSQLILVATVA